MKRYRPTYSLPRLSPYSLRPRFPNPFTLLLSLIVALLFDVLGVIRRTWQALHIRSADASWVMQDFLVLITLATTIRDRFTYFAAVIVNWIAVATPEPALS